MPRIQLVIRDWSSPKDVGLDGGDNIDAATRLNLIYGIMEVPAGSVPDDSRMPIVLDLLANRVTFGEASVVKTYRYGEDQAVSEITGWLTSRVWQGPVSPLPPGFVAGQVFARRCALQASPGHEAMLLCGIVSASSPLPSARLSTMIDGMGRTAKTFDLTSPGPEVEFEPGSTATQVYQQAIWGWGAEPVGFLTTLRLDLSNEMDRLRPLTVKADRTDEETALLADFSSRSGGLLQLGMRDREFVRFQRLLLDVSPDRRPTTEPRTADEIAMWSRLAGIVMRTMMVQDDDRAAVAEIRQTAAEAGVPVASGDDADPAPVP